MGVVGSGLAAANFLADEASASKISTLKVTNFFGCCLDLARRAWTLLQPIQGFAEAGESFVIP
jgi:hypothetical protein